MTLAGLEANKSYSVAEVTDATGTTEGAPGAYVAAYSAENVTVNAGQTANIEITNTVAAASVMIDGYKWMSPIDHAFDPSQFSFNLYASDQNGTQGELLKTVNGYGQGQTSRTYRDSSGNVKQLGDFYFTGADADDANYVSQLSYTKADLGGNASRDIYYLVTETQ